MPMIPFVPETLILSGEVNDNFQNAVSVDTPRNITVSHNWTARQNVEGGIALGNGSADQPSLTFLSDPDLGFYRKSANVIGVAGRLDLPGFGIVAGSGIQVSGGSTTPFRVAARRSADGGNALVFGTDGGLFVTPGEVSISTDTPNALTVGSDGGLYVPGGFLGQVVPSGTGDYTLEATDAGNALIRAGAVDVDPHPTWTIPPDVFAVDTWILIVNIPNGGTADAVQLTLARGAGVTLHPLKADMTQGGALPDEDVDLGRGTIIYLYQIATNRWIVWTLNS